jgi:hypothetical protein
VKASSGSKIIFVLCMIIVFFIYCAPSDTETQTVRSSETPSFFQTATPTFTPTFDIQSMQG